MIAAMTVKILSVRQVAAGEVKRGDLLIDRKLSCGFGRVEIIGRCEFPARGLELVVGRVAFDYDATGMVEVADTIVDRHGYGIRAVEGDLVTFRSKAPLYEGPVD